MGAKNNMISLRSILEHASSKYGYSLSYAVRIFNGTKPSAKGNARKIKREIHRLLKLREEFMKAVQKDSAERGAFVCSDINGAKTPLGSITISEERGA